MNTITTQSTAQVSQPIHHAPPLVEFDDAFTDAELDDLEATLSRNHDDATYWMSGGGINV